VVEEVGEAQNREKGGREGMNVCMYTDEGGARNQKRGERT